MAFKKGESGNPNGRPPGRHRESKLNAHQRRELVRQAGLTPAQYLLSVMVDVDEKPWMRQQAAVALLPYMHRKLPTMVEVSQPGALGLDPAAVFALPPERRRLLLDILSDMGVSTGPGPATEQAMLLPADYVSDGQSPEGGA